MAIIMMMQSRPNTPSGPPKIPPVFICLVINWLISWKTGLLSVEGMLLASCLKIRSKKGASMPREKTEKAMESNTQRKYNRIFALKSTRYLKILEYFFIEVYDDLNGQSK